MSLCRVALSSVRNIGRWWQGGSTALDEEAGLREAYDAHGGELYRMALRTLNDAGLAEEAVQDTFVRAWRAADRYDPRVGSLRTWLFAICKRVIIDLHRVRSTRPAPAGSVEANETRVADGSIDPIEQALLAWHVEEALSRISEEHRRALRETYYKGRPYREVAEEIGVPEGTLRSRVYYGLKALKVALEEMGWG